MSTKIELTLEQSQQGVSNFVLTYLATTTDSESEPFKDSRETEIPQPLPIAPSPVPSSDDPYLIPLAARTSPSSSDHTPISFDSTSVSPLIDEESEASKPSDTRITSSHSTAPLDFTIPLSLDHLLAQTSPASTRFSYYRSTASALSPSLFRKRYRYSYETPSPSSSLTFPIRKWYRGISELVEDTEDESLYLYIKGEGSEKEGLGSKDEGPGLEEEGASPKGQQQAVLVVDTVADKPLGLGYRALRLSPLSPAIPTLVASPTTTLATTISVDEDEFLEVGVPLELHGSILHNHTQCLDVLPPALFEVYDRDLRKLYTRLREVKDEIFSQRYTLRNLDQEQERATVTFSAIWRPVLALESWTGHVDA
nr:hypothetical protein [Tanacetum cinerariifolium]